MKIAVTGKSSEIGINLVRQLKEMGYEESNFIKIPMSKKDSYFDIERSEIIKLHRDTHAYLGWRYWEIGYPVESKLRPICTLDHSKNWLILSIKTGSDQK